MQEKQTASKLPRKGEYLEDNSTCNSIKNIQLHKIIRALRDMY